MPPGLQSIAAMGLTTGWLAFTVAESRIARGVRYWIGERSESLGDLVRCGHCLSVWIALPIVLLSGGAGFGFVIDTLAVAAVASLFWGSMIALTEVGGK